MPTPIGTIPTRPQEISWPLAPIGFPQLPTPVGPAPNPSAPLPMPTVPVQSPPTSPPPVSTPANVAAVVAGNNQFAYDLYSTLSGTNTGNMIFSPYSISTALAMTYAGAKGQTATEMAQTLHFTLPQDDLHPAMGQLMYQINSQGGSNYQLDVANHLWGQTGFAFLPSYLNTTRNDYQAPLTPLDFIHDPEGARKTINTWTANQTNQKILDLLPPGSVTSAMRLNLTNAVYFKGNWDSPFDANQTRPETFHLSGGSLESAAMMHQRGMFMYGAFQNFSMLDMPYAGGDLSMVAILPSQTASLSAMEKSFNMQILNQDERELTNTTVQVGLPKFTMTQGFNLGGTLAGMGMPSAFGAADFSGMDGAQDLSISGVIHKAFISVDEKGTEAAAATSIGVEVTSVYVPPPPQAIFDADRPFDFLIRDDKSGSILFMGRMSDPGGKPILTPLPGDSFFSSSQLIWIPPVTLPPDLGVGFPFPPSSSPAFGPPAYPPASAPIVISTVPEPSTWALFVASVVMISARSFTRRIRRIKH
jgi:serpin B